MVDVEATIRFNGVPEGASSLSCGVRVLLDPSKPSDGEGTNVLVSVVNYTASSSSSSMLVPRKKSLHVTVSDSSSRKSEVDAESDFTWTVAVPSSSGGLESADAGLTATLRVLVDSSVVESFVDGGAATLTVLPNPSDPAFVGVAAVSQTSGGGGGSCTFETLKIFPMNPFKYDLSLCASKGCLYP